jgi:LuxR family transcriptional regulator, maltose regulon positive regulatory protein
MIIPLVQTKLHIPRLNQGEQLRLVPRARLWEKLNTGQPGQLTLISASAGFGKTTLIAEWISAMPEQGPFSRHHAAWLTLDEGDNDPVRFFAYLIAAIQCVAPAIGQNLASSLHSPGLLPPEAITAQLINEISQHSEKLILVLDDYHTINSTVIHTSLRYLLDRLPPKLHLILITRSDPPVPLARLRAQGSIVEIRVADLSFNAEETEIFLNEIMQLNLAADDVLILMQRTEGWAVGLQLAALYLNSGVDAQRFIPGFSGGHAYIIDYLVEEVLARQPEEVKQFLLYTSVLDRICASLADAICSRRDSQRLLEALERANLFLIPLDQERKWYRYHHLFAEMLRRMLELSDPQQVPVLHEWAAIWFEQHEHLDEAIYHAFASTHLDHAASLLEVYAERLIARGEFTSLTEWLNRLPAEIMRQYPRLTLAQAECFLFHHQLEKGEASLFAVEEQVMALPPDPTHVRLLGKVAVLRSDIAVNRGDLDSTIALTKQALTILPADEWRLRARAFLLQGVGYFWLDQYSQARHAYAESARWGIQAGDLLDTIYAIGNLAQILYIQGLLQQAVATIQRAFAFAAEHHADRSIVLASSLAMYGELLYAWNRLDEAGQQIDEAIRRAQLAKNPRTLLRSYTARLSWLYAQGRMAEVETTGKLVERLAQDYSLPPTMMDNFTIVQMRIWLREKKFGRVADWLRQKEIDEGDAIPAGQVRLYGLLAELHFARQEYPAALRVIDAVVAAQEKYGPTLNLLFFQTVKSLILAATGNADASVDLLRWVLAKSESEGVIRPIVDLGDPMRHLLLTSRTALSSGPDAVVSTSYIDQLLAAFPPSASAMGETQESSPVKRSAHAPADALIEPLSARELEVLHWVQQGFSDSQIASQLILAVGTVKRHLNNIYGKLGVRSRTQALARARALNLLTIDD